MRYALNEPVIKAIGRGFDPGDTVTIVLYNAATGIAVPIDSAVCTPWGTSGIFEWDFQNITDFPTAYGNYYFVMKNTGGTVIVSEPVIIGGYINDIQKTVLLIPFTVNLEKIAINKGDSWEPVFQVDGNVQGLKVKVELSDIETTINKANAAVEGGADNQVDLVAAGDTFQIYRLHVAGTETVLFDSNFVDIKITIETLDGKIQTTKQKVPFSQSPAISWDTV